MVIRYQVFTATTAVPVTAVAPIGPFVKVPLVLSVRAYTTAGVPFTILRMTVLAAGKVSVRNHRLILRPASARTLFTVALALAAGLPVLSLSARGPLPVKAGADESLTTVPAIPPVQNVRSNVSSVPASSQIVAIYLPVVVVIRSKRLSLVF